MAISGLGSQAITQFPQRTAASAEKNLNKATETSQALKSNSVKASEVTTSLFKSVVPSDKTASTQTTRRNVSSDEVNSRRFQVQSESKTLEGQSGKALQSFLDVADFERKDELTQSTGIDIFI